MTDKRVPPPDLGTLSGPEAQSFLIGVNAVIWGYPAVLFEDLMAGLDAQISSLKRQAKQAERYTELTHKIQSAEARLLFARWREAAFAAKEARAAAEIVAVVFAREIQTTRAGIGNDQRYAKFRRMGRFLEAGTQDASIST